GDPGFGLLLEQVRERSLDAFRHQEIPFDKLVEELDPERTLAHSPLFQALFAFESTPAPPFVLPGLEVRTLAVGNAADAKFDLALLLHEAPDGIAGSLSYRADLFDAAPVERMAAHFQTLLAAGLADPRTPVSGLPCLGEAER